MAKSYSVTSAGVSAAEDRAHRMRFYFVAMALRMACVASLFFVRGWWLVIPITGAILLPYFAVMIGNAVASDPGQAPDAPEPLQIAGAEPEEDTGPDASGALIVIDAPADRRAHPATAAEAPAASTEPGEPAEPSEQPGEPAEHGEEDPA